MRTTTLTVAEMVRNFSEYVNRATYRDERFILTKGRKAVAELRPIPAGRTLDELGALLESLPVLTDAEAERFAADIEDARAHLPQAGIEDPRTS